MDGWVSAGFDVGDLREDAAVAKACVAAILSCLVHLVHLISRYVVMGHDILNSIQFTSTRFNSMRLRHKGCPCPPVTMQGNGRTKARSHTVGRPAVHAAVPAAILEQHITTLRLITVFYN